MTKKTRRHTLTGRSARWLMVIAAPLLLAACGDDDDAGGGGSGSGGSSGTTATTTTSSAEVFYCDSSATNQQCSEYSSPTSTLVDDFKTTCTTVLTGALVSSCPTGMVGGCERSDATEAFTVWFYPPNTEADVDCGSSATFVPPPS